MENVFAENYPRYVLSQQNYDSRYKNKVTNDKAVDWIKNHVDTREDDQPFFMFNAMRAGHKPFNTPPSYRNTTDCGVVGESIAEMDDLVGDIVSALKQKRIYKN